MPEPTRWGLTLPFAGEPLAATGRLVRRAGAAGRDDLWSGDAVDPMVDAWRDGDRTEA